MMEILLRTAGEGGSSTGEKSDIFQIHEIDELLFKVFSGMLSKEEADRCIHSLYVSPIFYSKFLKKLTESASLSVDQSMFSPVFVTMKSDKEILERILKATCMQKLRSGISTDLPQGRLANSMRNILSTKRPTFRWTVFAITAAIIFLAVSVMWHSAFYHARKSRPEFLIFNRTVPFPYDQSGLRGFNEIVTDPRESVFMRQFKLGTSDYVKKEFARASASFETGESFAQQLIHDSSMAVVVRDYYFYWGMSRLSAVRRETPFSEGDRKNLMETVGLLTQAISVAEENGLNGTDREVFYLGLSLGLEGKKTEAYEYLNKIPTDSRFFLESQVLSIQWTE